MKRDFIMEILRLRKSEAKPLQDATPDPRKGGPKTPLDEAQIDEAPAAQAETDAGEHLPAPSAETRAGSAQENDAPLTKRWFDAAMHHAARRALKPKESAAEALEGAAAELGISPTYLSHFLSAMKGYDRAVENDRRVAPRLSKASHVVPQLLGRWPEETFQEGLARMGEHLDGLITVAQFKAAFEEAKRAKDAEQDAKVAAEPPEGAPADTADKDGNETAPARWIDVGEAFLRSIDAMDGRPLDATIKAIALQGDIDQDELAAAVDATRGNIRVRALNPAVADTLALGDARISALMMDWPEDRMGEAIAMAHATVLGIVTLADLEQATDFARKAARTLQAIEADDKKRRLDATHEDNMVLAMAWWDAGDHYGYHAVAKTVANLRLKCPVTLTQQDGEPDQIAIDSDDARGWLTIIRPGLTPSEYALARHEALARAAVETYDRSNRYFAVIALPTEAGPDAMAKLARSKRITSINVLRLDRAETWAGTVIRTDEGEKGRAA